MKLLLELLRGNETFRVYIQRGRSAVLGVDCYWRYSGARRDDLDELADYCPDIVEMSCFYMENQVVEFRTS
jgi:hypothetical protein